MVLEMRRRGVRVDIAAAEKARGQLLRKRDAIFADLSEKLGSNVGMAEIGRNKWLAETFDQHKIGYPRTAKGTPSFTAGTTGWMHKHPHWLPQLIAKADKYNKAAVDFLETHILGHATAGRIHAEIHPHRSDEGGTRSLRFSYSNPPLQQMAARDEEIAPLIRGVFLPEEGEVWAKPDISQQEFRFIVHYAAKLKLTRAEEAAERYRADPNTDFHAFVSELTSIERKQAERQLCEGIRRRRPQIRGDDRQVGKRGASNLCALRPFIALRASAFKALRAYGGIARLSPALRRRASALG
jgi:DNA polymerase I-like protein with 3'-5' exonuclease and polymerase domains